MLGSIFRMTWALRLTKTAAPTDIFCTPGEHARREQGLHGGYKNAGWDRTLGKMFNFRAAAGCHLLFLAAELSILTMVEVLDVLSSRVIVFNCSLWRLILQNSGSPFTGGLFFDVILKRRREELRRFYLFFVRRLSISTSCWSSVRAVPFIRSPSLISSIAIRTNRRHSISKPSSILRICR